MTCKIEIEFDSMDDLRLFIGLFSMGVEDHATSYMKGVHLGYIDELREQEKISEYEQACAQEQRGD